MDDQKSPIVNRGPGFNQYHCPDCGRFPQVVHHVSEPVNDDEPVRTAEWYCPRCRIDWREADKGQSNRNVRNRDG